MAEGTSLSCDAVDELAGAYVVAALPADELEQVRAHLAACREPHSIYRELAEAAALLPYACEEVAPPASLRDRIVAAALSEQKPPLRVVGTADHERAGRRRPRQRLGNAALWLAPLAAACLVLAVGLGEWGYTQHVQLGQRGSRLQTDQSMIAALAGGARAIPIPATNSLPAALLVQPRDGSAAYLVVDFPRPADEKVYQAWFVANGQAISAGVFAGNSGGPQVLRLTRDLNDMQLFAITVEPKGGSRTPTGPPVMQRTLS